MDGLKATLSFDAFADDYDDEYLTIDTDTHTININNVSRLFGVQYDGNSKLIKFRIRNKLSDIQKMQDSIVYINWIDSRGVKGQSIAINKTINNDTCEFAWKVPFDALKNSGVLHFAMSAVITENGSSVINQKWSTQIASVITPDGIYIKSYTPSSEEEDRIAQIYNELSNMINKQNDNLQSQVNSLKENLDISVFYANKCPFVKELFINEIGKKADVSKINNIFYNHVNEKYSVTFSNSTGEKFTARTLRYDEPYMDIMPIYLEEQRNIICGYIILDWSSLESDIDPQSYLEEKSYNIDFSPRINNYVETINGRILTPDNIHTRKIGDKHETNFDTSLCVNQIANTNPLYTNGFVAEKDCVLFGVKTTQGVSMVDVYVSKGKYNFSHEWRCKAISVPVVTSKIVEDEISSVCAWLSSYNLQLKKGDEVYVKFYGTFRYSNDISNLYNALQYIDSNDIVTVPYIVAFNLIYHDLTDEYDTLSCVLDKKICVIGDSLTQGVDFYKHVIGESYPFWLSRFLGCQVLNFGQMGRTVQTWWDNYKSFYKYDSSIDAVLIMFGTNGGLTVNTLATDVEPYTNWSDYANTNCGDYCKLIEYIMEQTNNHAQIILMTPSYSSYTTEQTNIVIESESVIRAIAKRYNLPVIDVLNESGMGAFNASTFRPHDGCHFNAKGYHRLGTFIGSRVKSMISTWSDNDTYSDEKTIV